MAVIVPQQSRPAGTYTREFSVPAGTLRITATMIMSAANRANTANEVDFDIQGTNDGDEVPEDDANWQPVAANGHWQGGVDPKSGQTKAPPGFSYFNSAGVYRRIRARATTSRQWSWGVDATASQTGD